MDDGYSRQPARLIDQQVRAVRDLMGARGSSEPTLGRRCRRAHRPQLFSDRVRYADGQDAWAGAGRTDPETDKVGRKEDARTVDTAATGFVDERMLPDLGGRRTGGSQPPYRPMCAWPLYDVTPAICVLDFLHSPALRRRGCSRSPEHARTRFPQVSYARRYLCTAGGASAGIRSVEMTGARLAPYWAMDSSS